MDAPTTIPAADVRSAPRYVLAEDVVLVPIEDGTARLLDLCGDVYSLPASGAALFQAMLEEGEDAAVREIAQRYGVDPGQVRGDLDELLRDFSRKGLIHPPGAAGRQHRLRRFFASMLLSMIAPVVRSRVLSLEARAWMLLAAARVSFAWFRWTPTLGAWEQFWRRGPAAAEPDHRGIAQAIDGAVRAAAARNWFKVECKERSLCCWALARAAGLPSELVIGVQAFPFAGHCWCEAGPLTLSDDRTRIDFFKPIVKYS